MAALDFPDAPTVGQVYDKWTWNGTMWVLTSGAGGGSGFTFAQDAVPTATALKQTWFKTDTGDSFVWTNDGNSTQWVQFAPGGAGGGGGGSGFTFVQDTPPTPVKVGDTWFDTSTAASGGTSWIAIEEGAVGSEKVWVQFAPGTATSVAPRIYTGALNVLYKGTVSAAADLSFCPGSGTVSPGYIGPTNTTFPFPVNVFATAIELVRGGTCATTGVTFDMACYYNSALGGSTGVNIFAVSGAHNSVTHKMAYSVPANSLWGFKTRLVLGAGECWSEANFVIQEIV